MPKHKKTREQKLRADERRTSLPTTVPSGGPTYSFSFSSHPSAQHQQTTVVHTDTVVRKDLQKTAFVSVAILVLQIVLFLLLKNHVLAISFARY